ncbi:hypothetical protein [Paenibacillus naphthalenovorans]|nr:hypothetical protein [Paenibacillus naphthalenovorans]GCL71332.1 hypothetical protein PN4B1_12370 [Paenibacillus naphthalenovorans]SDI73324.1 hypothetical protein SAMN05421868_1102 [Paenibacillus naphthalenovorans]
MGKLEIACLIAVRLEGAAMFLSGARTEPSQARRASNLNAGITAAAAR